MNKNRFLTTLGLSGLLVCGSTNIFAYETGGEVYEAPVISSNPVYKTVQVNSPTEQCFEEAVVVKGRQSNSYTPEILGAIVGAGIGRLFGSGRGQDTATVAGAVLGGSIGRDQKNKSSTDQVRYEQRCHVVDKYRTEQRFDGYDVIYEYNGIHYKTHTQQDPGTTIKVSVQVVPLE